MGIQGENIKMRKWNEISLQQELEKIKRFIRTYVFTDETVVIPVSGGLDSDVVARLCCAALGNQRVKLFIVIQSEMEEKFLKNARGLAESLGISLKEIHLEKMNEELVKALENAEEPGIFCSDILLDPAKAKCSVRSSVISCYQDKGYIIAGTTNRTEKELGFFLTFGDNLANLKPIEHLYKSELTDIAFALGTAPEVISQESSAGFWEGQTDMEDLAYWILNDGPIVMPREFSDSEVVMAEQIKNELSPEKIDTVLSLYNIGRTEDEIEKESGLSEVIVAGLIHIVEKSKKLKNRKIMVQIED